MPYHDTIDRELRLVRTRVWGRVVFDEALEHHVKLRARADFDPTFNQLIDATDLEEASIDSEQAYYIGTRPLFSPNSRRALVVLNAAPFGVAHMVMKHREMADTGEKMLVTRDMQEALKFLGISSESSENS
ncbi:MAG TPA: hypothetical protein VGL89_12350 [Candidatus Koribacter sp.]|jgi:hypothetical protein